MLTRRLLLALLLITACVTLVSAPAIGQGLCGVFYSYSLTDTVSAANLNGNFVQAATTNSTPQCVQGDSASLTQMRATVDPYPSQVASLATSLEGELQRLRYIIEQATGFTNWYNYQTGHRLNVKSFGAKGDNSADDRTAIANAVTAIPTTGTAIGAVLFFPCGTYQTNSSSALVSVTDKNSVWLQGSGVGCTTLIQNGSGNGVEFLGTTEIANVHISDLSVKGANGAGIGIKTTNMKDSVIERFAVSGFLGGEITIGSANNLNNVIRDGRTTSGVGAAANANAAISIPLGNSNRVEKVYFNNGGNDSTHHAIALNVVGCDSCRSINNIYDGVTTAIKSNGVFLSENDWFDGTSGGGIAITTAFNHGNNNPITIINARGLTKSTYFVDAGISFNMWTVIGALTAGPSGGSGLVNGQPLAGSFAPASFGTSQNDYNPSDATANFTGQWYRTWRVTASAGSLAITGIQAPGLVAGGGGGGEQEITIVNIGANTFAINNQDVNSAANNRIITSTGAAVNLATDKAMTLQYDSATLRWRTIGTN